MKNKLLAVILAVTLSLSLFACASSPPDLSGGTDTEEVTPSLPEEGPPAEDTPSLPPDESEDTPTAPPDEETPTVPPDESEALPPAPPTETPPEEVPDEPQVRLDTLMRSTANGLNVRKGAGASYASIGSLDKDDMVMPIRKTGGWYEIYYKGARGYVSASYLEEESFEIYSDAIEKVIAEGKKLLGIPYVYGAQRYHFGNGSLNSKYDGKSYDCSSLMQYIFKIGANVNLAMTSREQSLQGEFVARADIRRGDLLFFTNASRYNKTGLERIGHVALYLGKNVILHTASDHAVIEPISAQRSSYYITARRVIK